MEALFQPANCSRQAFHQWQSRLQCPNLQTDPQRVMQMARDVRKDNLPGGGARTLYFHIRNKRHDFNQELVGWGKHRFEALCLSNGFRVCSRRFIPKTTQKGDFIFPNRIEGMQISDVNKVWVCDISYVFGTLGNLIGYETSLIDVYSRLLLGLCFSKNMKASETVHIVLQQAFDMRKNVDLAGLIFHSDGGKQFIESNFLNSLKSRNIISSMARNCYENPFAEAMHDTIKNHMLFDQNINSLSQLVQQQDFLKFCYNANKPHSALKGRTPLEFEHHLLSVQPCQRTILKIKKIEPLSCRPDLSSSLNLS